MNYRQLWNALTIEQRQAQLDALRAEYPYASGAIIAAACIANQGNVIDLVKFKRAKEIKGL